MSASYLRAAGFVLVALLAFPRPGNAGLIDFILEMSGPEMFSWLSADCEFRVKNVKPECRLYDIRVKGDVGLVRAERNLWFIISAAVYTSTGGLTADSRKYNAFENHMISLDPALRFKAPQAPGWLRHGAGFTYHHLWGESFDTFDKLGVKVEPFTIPLNKLRVPVRLVPTIRIFPAEFTHEQFGMPDGNRKREVTYGLNLEIG